MATPTQIGHYEILGLIGRGGMGEVYRAQDTKMFRRLVAIKVIAESLIGDADALRRFHVEQETVAGLQHPNIVTIYDRGEFEDRQYFVMEYLEGCDLAHLIRERVARSLDQRIEIAIQVAEALDFAHRRDVIHRDIKPSNVMVIRRGDLDQAKLLDFGIVHVSRSGTTKTVTQPGTLLYMSPEQLRSESVTSRTDLFSLGIVLFELFTGVHPFKAVSEPLVTAKILYEPPVSAREQDSAIPAELDGLLANLLEKDPARRPESAGFIATELRRILRGPSLAQPTTDPPKFGNLDEMMRSAVESIVKWARKREADGALQEALEGYRRAALIAPSAEWLQQRIALLEPRVAAAATREAAEGPPSEATQPDTERERFVAPRLRAASAALEEGDLQKARASVVEILRKYPNEGGALRILDRVLAIIASRIDYRAYSQHVRRAVQALDASSFGEARAACAAAVALWPEDPEGTGLQRRIEARVQEELGARLAECERLLSAAEAEVEDLDRALRSVAEAQERLREGGSLGADAETLRELSQRADRLDEAIRARQRNEQKESIDRFRRNIALLAEARALLAEAGKGRDPRSMEEAEHALALLASAQDRLGQRTEPEASHPEAQVEARKISELQAAIGRWAEERRRLEDEIKIGLAGIRDRLRGIESLVGGGLPDLERCRHELASARSELQRLGRLDPDNGEIATLDQKISALATSATSRQRALTEQRDTEERIGVLLEEAGTALHHAEAARMGTEGEVQEGLARCSAAAARIREVIGLRAGEPTAGKLEQRRTALESELNARLLNVRTEKDKASVESKLRSLLQQVSTLRSQARELSGQADEEADTIEKLLREAQRHLDQASALAPGNASVTSEQSAVAAELREIEPLIPEAKRLKVQRGGRTRLEVARRLVSQQRSAEAMKLVESLERDCRGSADLGSLLPFVLELHDELLKAKKDRTSRWLRVGGGLVAATVVVSAGWFGVQWWNQRQAEQHVATLIGEVRALVDGAEKQVQGTEVAKIGEAIRELQAAGSKIQETLAIDPPNGEAKELQRRVTTIEADLRRRKELLAAETQNKLGVVAAGLREAQRLVDSAATAASGKNPRRDRVLSECTSAEDWIARVKAIEPANASAASLLARIETIRRPFVEPPPDERAQDNPATIEAIDAAKRELAIAQSATEGRNRADLDRGVAACESGISRLAKVATSDSRLGEVLELRQSLGTLKSELLTRAGSFDAEDVSEKQLQAWRTQADSLLDTAEDLYKKGGTDDLKRGVKLCSDAAQPIQSIRKLSPKDDGAVRLGQRQTDLASKLERALQPPQPSVDNLTDLSDRLSVISAQSSPENKAQTESRLNDLRKIGDDLRPRRSAPAAAALQASLDRDISRLEAFDVLFEYSDAYVSMDFKQLRRIWPDANPEIEAAFKNDYRSVVQKLADVVVTADGDGYQVACRVDETVATKLGGKNKNSYDLLLELERSTQQALHWVIADRKISPRKP